MDRELQTKSLSDSYLDRGSLFRVISSTRRYAEVFLPDQSTVLAKHACGDLDVSVGDIVELTKENEEWLIHSRIERFNELHRSFERKHKVLAANISELWIVCQPLPNFNQMFLDRVLCAATNGGIKPKIILNKCDLRDQYLTTQALLEDYQALGLEIYPTSARDGSGIRELLSSVDWKLCGTASSPSAMVAIIGMSGVGKSSIIAHLLPDQSIRTRETGRGGIGRQTTSQAQGYLLPRDLVSERIDQLGRPLEQGGLDAFLIDLPGVQNFGLAHLDLDKALIGFPEIKSAACLCRFGNCRHEHEPDCAVQERLGDGRIKPDRFRSWCEIKQEIERFNPYGRKK